MLTASSSGLKRIGCGSWLSSISWDWGSAEENVCVRAGSIPESLLGDMVLVGTGDLDQGVAQRALQERERVNG